jgi:hypothetical protein
MSKIVGNTTATPVPRSNWEQTDKNKIDYIRNKPTLGVISKKDVIAKDDLTTDVQSSLEEIETKANVVTLTTEEYEALENDGFVDANTLYMLSNAEEETPYVVSDIAPDNTSVFWVDTTDNTGDYEQVVVDSTLTQSGWAADAKVTGDTINTITVQLNNMTTKLNNMIYVGRTAPINAVDGMVWVDISESQTTNNEVI